MTAATLIIGPAWIGDMIMAQSLFRTLKQAEPGRMIDVIAPSWCLPLLERMPQVRKPILAAFGHGEAALAARWRLGRSLTGQYDWSIVLPNSWKSALVPFAARIRRRTGWRGEMRFGLLNDLRHLDKQRLPLMVDRFNSLAYDRGTILESSDFPRSHPLPALRQDPALREAAREKFGLRDARPVLALCPGAEFGPAKRWPPTRYAEVALHHIRAGWQVWLFGSSADREAAETIRSALDPQAQSRCHMLAGRTSLLEAIDLLGAASLALTNDSGLMHLAAALGVPLAAVFGSTSPDHTPPLSAQARTVSLGLSCSPCFQRQCPLGHMDCLNKLSADRVLAAMREVLP